jgi:hypothetical protein
VPFSERTKLKVRRAAAFQCCMCRETGVEVHHIEPEGQGGRNTFENAAPLCPTCHDKFGDNPRKRKQIREMRDWWYDHVKVRFPTVRDISPLNDLLVDLARGELSKRDELIAELQCRVDELNEKLEESDTGGSPAPSIGDIVSATRLGDQTWANVHCKACNSYTGMLVGSDVCPGCGAPLG